MSILVRVIIFILGIYALRHLFVALIGRNKRTEAQNKTADSSTHMVKDPVCCMYMDSRLAVRLENKNETYYFCSEGCKTKFLNLSSGPSAGAAASGSMPEN
jgi:YHS domain-containing protein